MHLLGELLLEQVPESVAVLGELLDTFVQLVEGHLVLEELPAELGLVVDVGDFRVVVQRLSWENMRAGSSCGRE